MMNRLLVAAIAFALCLPRALPTENRPPQESVAAYVALVQADLARDQGKFSEAKTRYMEALALYQELARAHPSWYPDIVQYRIAYCRSQVEALRNRPDAQPHVEESASALEAALNRASALETENTNLQARIATLEADLADARAAREAAEQNTRKHEAALREANDTIIAQSEKISRLERESLAQRDRLVEVEALLGKLREALAAAELDRNRFFEEKTTVSKALESERETAARALADCNAAREAAERARSEAARTVDELRGALEAERRLREALQGRAAELERLRGEEARAFAEERDLLNQQIRDWESRAAQLEAQNAQTAAQLSAATNALARVGTIAIEADLAPIREALEKAQHEISEACAALAPAPGSGP